MSKAFGILADRPECYIYSPAVGCVITGVPREDIVTHYSCRQTLAALHQTPGLLDQTAVSKDLLAIINGCRSNEGVVDQVVGMSWSR
ncbi:hypothetical protein [Streptomyces sp. NPDC051286]|uniref:hypothetical protein n=1 Tax=Streptomyces sp. NPDC051286 TaxID=3365647 RepID=UPI00378F20E1